MFNSFEWIGVIASIFIFLSFLFKKPTHIRVVNSIGSVLFLIYGVLLGAFSVWFMNVAIIILQVYQIIKDNKLRKTDI